jgi:hypothetical protein
MLDHVQPGDGCWDRLHRPANFQRGGRLHVERFKLTWRSVQKQQDTVLGAPKAGQARSILNGIRFQQATQAEPQKSRAADVKQITAGDAVAKAFGMAEDAEHKAGRRSTDI